MPPLSPHAVPGEAQFQAGRGSLNPAAFQLPNVPPPDPSLAEGARQRRTTQVSAQRDAELYYAMQHSPQPWQYSRTQTNHPALETNQGDQYTQYAAPQGPPQGFAARSPATVYGIPGVQPHPGRPTHAYNRVVGNQTRNPVMYSTWPSQYYPGGSNTYIPSWEATGMIIKFTRNPSNFRINKYIKDLNVPKDQAYYLTLNTEDPYRVVNVNDFLWEDSADASGGRQNRQGFGFMPYRTARYVIPFSLGQKSVQQADWPILAEHAAMAACVAMTIRTKLSTTQLTTAANFTGSWGTNTSAVSNPWTTSTTSNYYIKKDIDTAMIAIEQNSGGIVNDEEALYMVINPTLARGVGSSPEYRDYIKGSPDALAAQTDYRNPNRKYSLAPYLYGLNLVVENAIVVSTPKSGNVASPPSQTRGYVWATQYATIVSKPNGIVAEDEQTIDFSTVQFRFKEKMTTEQKSDPDNRREVGRVVEDYMVGVVAPQTGYLLTGIS